MLNQINSGVYRKTVYILFLLTSLFALALGIRRYVLMASYDDVSASRVPFALESALQSRRIKMIEDRGSLPQRDESISSPTGIEPAKEYTVFVDYLQAAFSRMAGSETPHTVKLRWIEAGFFCLSIPLLALWGWRASRSWSAGFMGAALYAVAISAVQRSTGAELSTENTAFPFLAAHFLARSFVAGVSGMRLLSAVATSALCLALAVASWDLMQFYVTMWSVWGVWQIARGRWVPGSNEAKLWQAEYVGLAALALLNTYHRTHSLIFSPAMLLGAVGLVALYASGLRAQKRLLAVGCAALVVVTAGMIVRGGPYAESYGHFADLLWAKLRYLNVKPDDPAFLTFDQRLMWTPALHSPTIPLTLEMLGILCAACFPAALAAARRSRKNLDFQQPLIGFVLSVLAYVFFFRFHVFVAFFGAMLVAVWWGQAVHRNTRGRTWVFIWIGFCVFAETVHTLRGPWSVRMAGKEVRERALAGRPAAALWGVREGIYYAEQVELTDWLAKNVAPESVLAGFGLSGPIATYGKCGIVLHPKFETKAAREKVKQYAEQLFTGTLDSFRAWADSQGASYFVYGMGAFTAQDPTLQLRYMVDAMNPPPTAPARLFEGGKRVEPLFRQVFSNRKYRVYKILTVADEVAAKASFARAKAAFERGEIGNAEREATAALGYNPATAAAEDILRHVESLRGKGFTPGHE